jgi:hypothetical protein
MTATNTHRSRKQKMPKKMSKKSKPREAQDKIAQAAKTGAAGAKDVASDALGAAATAAAGVVLQRVSEALAPGQQKVEQAILADQPAMTSRSRTTAEPRSGLRRAAPSRKRGRTIAKRMAAKSSKRAAARKKTLKKVASRKGLRKRSGK